MSEGIAPAWHPPAWCKLPANEFTPFLEVYGEGGQLVRSISLKRCLTFTFGGAVNCDADFTLDDTTVSGPHAVLIASSRAMFLHDLGSEHGTWLEEAPTAQRASTGPTRLEGGAAPRRLALDGTSFRLGHAATSFRISGRRHVSACAAPHAFGAAAASVVKAASTEGIGEVHDEPVVGVLWQGGVSTYSNSLGGYRRLGDFSSSDVGAVSAELPAELELRFCSRAAVPDGLKPLELMAAATGSKTRLLTDLRTFLEQGGRACHMRTSGGRDVFVLRVLEGSERAPWRLDCRYSKPVVRGPKRARPGADGGEK